jgi:hypothetical protein
MKAYGEWIFLTSALVGSEWSTSRLGRLPRGKSPQYPLDRRLGGPQSPSGRRGEEKILDLTGTRTPNSSVVQPVASRYTDYAIPVPIWKRRDYKNIHELFLARETLYQKRSSRCPKTGCWEEDSEFGEWK